jgi:hypothetical protein
MIIIPTIILPNNAPDEGGLPFATALYKKNEDDEQYKKQ